ncbi:amidase [Massilia putida]|uniref:amidase n=1 Tax=Massilia putida TaxID=1141883 RepID=UPI0009527061|nr:amidase [Massilia putida]
MSAFVERFDLGDRNGPTIAIKDCIDIEGMPTRAGSAALAEILPARRDAAVVDALIRAGWHIVGKTTMHELAYGMTGMNPVAGTPLNPQDPALIPGGSSSDSAAAVGSGEVDAALGSDTGGSIRLPAACCGVLGLKPTFGRVSRLGAWPRESSLDCVGPFARSALVLRDVMQAIAHDFDGGKAARPLAKARVGVLATGSDAAVDAAFTAALRTAGWQQEPRELPGMQAAFDAAIAVINQETWSAFGHLLDGGKVGADVAGRLRAAGTTTADARQQAERVRLAFVADVDRALEGVDALVLPTLPSLPPTLAEVAAGHSVIALSRLVRPFNLSGHPALSYPIPVPAMPIKAGLQLVGRKGDDERLCALALHLERALQDSQI